MALGSGSHHGRQVPTCARHMLEQLQGWLETPGDISWLLLFVAGL